MREQSLNSHSVVSEKLIQSCEQYLRKIESRHIKIDDLPTHCSRTIYCGNDVFDAVLLDNDTIATCHKTKPDIMIFSINTGYLIRVIETVIQNWEIIKVDDDRILIGSFKTKSLQMINWKTAQILKVIPMEASIMYYGHRTTRLLGGEILIAGLESSKLIIFDLEGTFATTFTGHTRGVTCVEVVPNARIITGSWDTTLKLWDISTGRCTSTFTGHSGPIASVRLVDPTTIVSGGYDYTIKLWNIETATCLGTVGQHEDWIRELLVLSSTLVCSVADDKKVKIWDIDKKECVKVLDGHTGCVNCIDITEDNQLISGSADGTVRVWTK
jgi:WD40 repeat protein